MRASAVVAGRLDADPVADRREIRPGRRVVAQPARDAGEPLTRDGQHAIDVRVLEADPRGHQTGRGMAGEGAGQTVVPAEIGQVNRIGIL